jgi:hypothetical protein
MKSGVFVTKNDLQAVLANINAMVGQRVYIGIPQEKNQRPDGGVGNATIAYINEKGSPAKGIPARPFLGPGVRKAAPQVLDALKNGARAGMMKRGGVVRGLRMAGKIAVDSVQATMVAGEGFAPLSQRTLEARRAKRRKSTKPLIETGRLKRSITYVIRTRKWRG